MSNKFLIILAALLLLLASGWYYLTSKNNKSNSVTTQTPINSTPSPITSLKDLLANGIAQTCIFSTQGSSGSVYVSDGKVRGDFDITVSEKPVKSHIIIVNNTSYIWLDGQAAGFKMAFDSNALPATNSGTQVGFDPTANNNYRCSTWVTDQSMFVLPPNINFSTITVPQASGSIRNTSAPSQCSYCNSLTGDDKTQCLVALKCN